MISIDDLDDIPENKKKQAIKCLDSLLQFRDKDRNLSPIISGYNLYDKLANVDRIITFSNIHGTEAYKRDMLIDLEEMGYAPEIILGQIREKVGTYLFDLEFRIRDSRGNLFPSLRIRDTRTGAYLNLESFFEPLINYPQFKDAEGYLIAENSGWQLDMPFNNKEELMKLVKLFLCSAGECIFNELGEIEDIKEEKKLRNPWRDAYTVPVLLLGKKAQRYRNELPQFDLATRLYLVEGADEINFIIHKNLECLKHLEQYEELYNLGFVEEVCLGNKAFLKYIDLIR